MSPNECVPLYSLFCPVARIALVFVWKRFERSEPESRAVSPRKEGSVQTKAKPQQKTKGAFPTSISEDQKFLNAQVVRLMANTNGWFTMDIEYNHHREFWCWLYSQCWNRKNSQLSIPSIFGYHQMATVLRLNGRVHTVKSPVSRGFISLAGTHEVQKYEIKRVLSYPPQHMYNVVSDVSLYSCFVPYCTESRITECHPDNGTPLRAVLKVGWNQFEESFESALQFDNNSVIVRGNILVISPILTR
jgi:hypothetical protein